MKILLIAPIAIPIDPNLKYGGIERVVLALDECFGEKEHEVIVAAPKDSKPYGKLLPTLSKSEWTNPKIAETDPNAYEKHVEMAINYILKQGVDIVHDHTGNVPLSNTFKKIFKKSPKLREIPFVATPHSFKRFKKIGLLENTNNIFFTTLSKYQKKVFSPYIDVKKVIYNGVFVKEALFSEEKANYLFSLGSIEESKGQDLAIKVALKTGIPLKIGGKVMDQSFFDTEIRPYLQKGLIEYVGELNDKQKKEYYVGAKAFLAPIRIGDCFSLTRIEALSHGTPTITLDTGSAGEAIRHEKTGYLINYDSQNEEKVVSGMVEAVNNIKNINPYLCRKDVEKRFDWKDISSQYIQLYENILSRK
ncbi:hypothetical protein CMI39_02915 [Candidatus Pacearchaeota archaeon]|jgi:glycosyltransferase involved in cell wall biosynthesis|nr:hypothetical protein [Candidatus Pacearchaeota archaeon]|tara:strand:+ start:21971 stop:23056 length:1086 start_codon:yes stop_codon:yes gene_type:complete